MIQVLYSLESVTILGRCLCDAVFFVYFISERQSYTWTKGRAFENWIILLFCDTFLFKVSRGEYEVSGGNNPIQNHGDYIFIWAFNNCK